MVRISLLFLLIATLIASVPAQLIAAELCLASWNVENLFDLEDDPSVEGDEEFTPQSDKKWTKERQEIKLKNLSSIISKLNNGRGPDVLGLCEIENRQVVELLVASLAPLGRKYEIVHKDSPSDRGIDTALIYDAKVFDLVDKKFHFVDSDNTRDIVEAELKRVGSGADGKSLYVFVNHWPSRGNDEWQRCLAGSVLRKRIDEILSADPKADIVMVGDFNDESDNVSIAKFLRTQKTPEIPADGTLFDTTAYVAADGKGTFVYDDKWELIDHIIISAGLLDGEGYSWKTDSSKPVEFKEIFFHPRWQGGFPRPSKSYSDTKFHKDGYSDHLAVECIITD
jgi:predicted extracellular nuclease